MRLDERWLWLGEAQSLADVGLEVWRPHPDCYFISYGLSMSGSYRDREILRAARVAGCCTTDDSAPDVRWTDASDVRWTDASDVADPCELPGGHRGTLGLRWGSITALLLLMIPSAVIDHRSVAPATLIVEAAAAGCAALRTRRAASG